MAPRAPSPAREAGRRNGDRHGNAAGEALPPWLEEADPEEPTHTLVGRRTLFAIVAAMLLLVAGVATGVFMSVSRSTDPALPAPGAEIPLVRSPGPWKLPADGLPEAEGRAVEGQDQILFDAGTGAAPQAAIDVNRLPEEPILPGSGPASPPVVPVAPGAPTVLLPDPPARAPAAPAAPAAPVAAGDAPAPDASASAPAPASPPPPTGPAITLQLGAYSSPARAREAFATLAQRHAPLAGLSPQVSPTTRDDGTTLHRLRVTMPDRAAGERLCARLKVAGDSCALVD